MPAVDKVIASARRHSQVVLVLIVSTAVLVASDVERSLLLSKARTAVSHWLIHDFIAEDFADWWLHQQVEKRSVADRFQPFETDRPSVGYEHYYTGFGAVRIDRTNPLHLVSVGQPSRDAPVYNAAAQIPDVRADIPDLRPWTRKAPSSQAMLDVTKPLSPNDAAVLLGTIGLNNEFKKSNPEKAARLPRILNEGWSADKRWLALGAEKEKASLQLGEVARSAGAEPTGAASMPAPYRSVERKLGGASVKIPVVDVELPSLVALWSLAALTCLTVALLHAALEGLTAEELSNRQEDWLPLDAKNGVSLILARAWVIAITIAPALTAAAILTVIGLRWAASEGGVVWTLVNVAVALVLGGGSTYFSLKVWRQLGTANPSLHRTAFGSR